ncbi:aminotransferase [Roseovarius sp. CH_XMU1461]|uniref:aminotransferase n=1 Tax=Roseovarius sp. CH_XMU1461 TaxID=3107777 RepID=UPI0030085FD0
MAQLFPFTDPLAAQEKSPLEIVRGDGCTVIDAQGQTYLDAVAGLWCASLGFTNARLTAAAQQQFETLGYYHSFMGRTPAIANRLSEKLAALLPDPLTHVLYGCSGSDAVETAAKLVRYYQNARGLSDKKRIIAREGAYHGSGNVSAALTAMSYCHDGFDTPASQVLRTGRPHYLRDAEPGETEIAFAKRRARELNALIEREDAGTIGAFIGEPAMGAGGVLLPPEGYWAEIQNVLARHDILLIADEIITGFGRTGRWFGCQSFGIEPDMMTMAKQLSASFFPISAVAMSQKVHDTIARQAHDLGLFGHGFTYGGHPVGAAVALETLAIYEEMDLEQHVGRLSDMLAERLSGLRTHPLVAEIRVKGLLAAVELGPKGTEDGLGTRVTEEAAARGVFFRSIGNVIAISPAYTISGAELDQIATTLAEAVEATYRGQTKQPEKEAAQP